MDGQGLDVSNVEPVERLWETANLWRLWDRRNLHKMQPALLFVSSQAGLFMVCWSGLKTSKTKHVQSSLTHAKMEITTCSNATRSWCFPSPFFGSAMYPVSIWCIHVQLKSRQMHDQILVEDVSQTLKGKAWRSSLKDLGWFGSFRCLHVQSPGNSNLRCKSSLITLGIHSGNSTQSRFRCDTHAKPRLTFGGISLEGCRLAAWTRELQNG